MKSKLYLIAICTSMLCGGSVYGAVKCPSIEKWDGKETVLEGWTLDKNKDPATPVKDWTFLNAWLYDEGGEPAKCHYTHPGKSGARLSFQKPNSELNSSTHHFDNVPRNAKHPGYHCKAPAPCAFEDGPSDLPVKGSKQKK